MPPARQGSQGAAAETPDLWERELPSKIADQWQVLAARGAAKKRRVPPKLVIVRRRLLPIAISDEPIQDQGKPILNE
jgi:hypothetical protein